MLRKLAVVLVILFTLSNVSHAQFVTSNTYVEADVSGDGQGLVSIFYAGTNHLQSIIHPSQTSYLTVVVGGKYYTNNQHVPLSEFPEPSPAFPTAYLDNGVTTYTGPNKDTIETVWQPDGPNTFDIVQDVYTVQFPIAGSGQVVFKFSIRNHTSSFASAQAQYLVDINLANGDTVNDNAPITTRYGYVSTTWTAYPPTNSIPPYFIVSLDDLSNDHFPNMFAEGYMNDSLAPEPMGLMEPSLFAYTDWREIVTGWTWGEPTTPAEYPTVGDEALLFQWPLNEVKAGDTEELGGFSYGSGACQPICFGRFDAMMIHPDHIKWNGLEYVPNHFPVDAVVWNGSADTVTSASGTQSIVNDATGLVNGPVEIVLPSVPPMYAMTLPLLGGEVPGQGSSSITWDDTVLASVLMNCSTDSVYNIAFSVGARGVGDSSCQNGTYVCPIMVDCQGRTYSNPVTTILNRTGSYDGSLCNTRCTDVVTFDTASTRIPVLSVVADTLSNMRLSIAPNHAGADSTFYTVCVVDSLLNGSAEIAVTDSLGNTTIEEYSYCTIADTHAPLVQEGICIDTVGGPCTYLVSDTQAWDRGLASIVFTNLNGVQVTKPDKVYGLGVIEFSVFGSGSFCITATDLAGNKFDTCFGTTASVSVPATPTISLSVSPNPTSGDVSIFIEGAPSADVEIFDVLGREVDRFSMNGSYEWETDGLPSGTYIIRANENGPGNSQPITKRIVKE